MPDYAKDTINRRIKELNKQITNARHVIDIEQQSIQSHQKEIDACQEEIVQLIAVLRAIELPSTVININPADNVPDVSEKNRLWQVFNGGIIEANV